MMTLNCLVIYLQVMNLHVQDVKASFQNCSGINIISKLDYTLFLTSADN